MKTMKILSAALLIGAVAMSCQKQPDAKISASKTTVEVNENITFTNSSTDANSYDWDFGDNQTSNLASPSHNWSNAGLYSVNMTVYSKNEKKKDNANLTITVNNVNKKFIGTWTVSENWDSDFCGFGTDNYTMTISEGSIGSTIVISNFANGFSSLQGNISGNTITIPTPQYYVYHSGLADIVDILSATGSLNNGTISMNYEIYDVDCGSMYGNFTATK